MLRFLFIFLSVCLPVSMLAQITNEENIIENTVANTESEFENENIIEDLQSLSYNPININDTSGSLAIFYQYDLLTPMQEKNITDYIKTYGKLITLNELMAVPGLNRKTIDQLIPFINVHAIEKKQYSLVEQLKYGRKRLMVRNQFVVEQQRGYQSTDSTIAAFAGNKHHVYLKFRQQFAKSLSIGLVADKDAGEAFFQANNSSGFDFYAGHIKYRPVHSIINQINIGDYEVKIGQGLIQWNGFSLGKGADASTVFLKSPVLREYTSSNEINYLRGLAADLQVHNNISTTFWASHKQMDANQLEGNWGDGPGKISSLQQTGYHRTPGEISDKGSTNQTITGVNTEYESDWLTVGMTGQYQKLSDSLIYRDQDYQRFYPKSSQFYHAGIHYTILKGRNYLFGETALTNNKAVATVNGIQHHFTGGLKGTLVYRNYSKKYTSLYGSAFGENTNVNNEEGMYLGLEYSPAPNITIETYYDYFRFPWKKFRVSKPSKGNELLFRTIYEPTEAISLELRNKFETKELDMAGNGLPSKQLDTQRRYSNRLELRYKPTELLYLKSRIGHTFYEFQNRAEHGFLVFQDLIYQFPAEELKLYGRMAVFHTPSYNSRVYAYENDLLYNFSVPAYYGTGSRWYFMTAYEPVRNIKLWFKASQTIFTDRDTISSGNTEIQGNKRTDMKLQIQWQF